MAFPVVFTKQLGAASANGIAASQSVTANTAMILNGSLSNYLSTTSSAAAAANAVYIPMTTTTGVVVGQSVKDTTAAVLVAGTVVKSVSATGITVWSPIGGAGVGSGDTIVFAGTAVIDTATASNSAIGRRVVVAYSGTDCNWVVTGTNGSGNAITDTIIGSGGAGQSNMDFVTVTGLTPTGSVTGATAGTNGVGSSPWLTLNWHPTSVINIGFAIELVSGAVNFTVQHTYDDPNSLQNGATYPLAINSPVVSGASATTDGVYAMPISAIRVLVNSGTGELRMRVLQSGIG